MARPALALGLTGALAGAFLAGTLVADHDRPGPRGGPDDASTLAAGPGPVPPAASGAPVSYADSCADLLAAYVERAEARVGPWGWTRLPPVMLPDVVMTDGFVEQASPTADLATSARAAVPAPVTQRATSGESGTNVQEAGVDEPDVVKTDGELLVRLDEGVLRTYDVSAGTADGEPLDAVGSVPVVGSRGGEILLSGDTVTVVVADTDAGVHDEAYAEGATRVHTVDVSDPATPTLTATTEYDGHLLGARLHGSTVRVVVAAGLPDLDFVQPGRRDERDALEDNRRIVRETTIEDWLPTVTDEDGTAEPLLDCDAVALPDEDAGLDSLAVVGFEAGDQRDRSVQGLVAAAEVAYFSTDHLYLVASHEAASSGWGPCCFRDTVDPVRPGPGSGPGAVDRDELDGTTTVHGLSLDGTGTTYLASGRVDGHVADRWAVDEHDGVLRLAVGPTQRTGNFNSVVTLAQDGPALVEAGRVDRLGVDEQIESVRWFDGLAFVVTFRQVDPLYAVDLTDPADPALLGELKIPGFSEYLHPLGGRRLVGVGQGPSGGRGGWGAQVGLFDVTDLTDPRRIDVLSYRGGTQALAGLDPRQLTWLPESRTVLTVVSEGWTGRTGYVSVISLDDGEMRNRMVEVEHGTDVDEVRTVPLTDGRVVLVTGDEVSFFAV